jgi:biotin operon repressor
MNKLTVEEFKEMMKLGFTPCFDFASECYPKDVDRVLGKMVRYAALDSGKCFATRERICKELGITEKTFDKKVKFLEAQGMIVDETPQLKNHSHTYAVNADRLLEEINLFNEYEGTEPFEIVVTDGEEEVVGKNSTEEKFPSAEEKFPSAEEKFPTDYGKIPYEEIEYLREDLRDSTEPNSKPVEAIASPEPVETNVSPVSEGNSDISFEEVVREFLLNEEEEDKLFPQNLTLDDFLKGFQKEDKDKVDTFLESETIPQSLISSEAYATSEITQMSTN